MGAQEFLCEQANIRLAIGGHYEIPFDPKRAVGDQELLLLTAIDTTFLLRRGPIFRNLPRSPRHPLL